MSDLDKDAFAAAYRAYQEIDCSGPDEPCNEGECQCLATMVAAYIAHVAATPADLRTVLAYDSGLAEGRRHGLEEAAKIVVEAQSEVQENIDQNVDEARAVQIKPSDNWPLIRARDWLRSCHENIRALIKEPKA